MSARGRADEPGGNARLFVRDGIGLYQQQFGEPTYKQIEGPFLVIKPALMRCTYKVHLQTVQGAS